MRNRRLRRKSSSTFLKKALASLAILAMAVFVFAGIFVASSLSSLAKLKNPKLANQPQRSIVYGADGSIIGSYFVQNREPVPIKRVPRYLRDAIVAVEDRRFYIHRGVDVEAIIRAMIQNITKRRIAEGGSTITQQYVKNAIIGNKLSITRKLKEAYIATQLERRYSKRQILEAYINTVYFGHGAYGVEAAAETYFGKKVQYLSLAEAALIAGLPKSPEGFSPYDNPTEAKRRQSIVLEKMVDEGYITKAQATEAKAQPLIYKPLEVEDPNGRIAPYFVEYVKQELLRKYGKEKVFGGGLRVYTTLDMRMQRAADTIVKSTLNEAGDPTASIVAIDPKTGYIKAMVGGRDFKTLKYNLATQGRRQPGSSFKVFVLVAALESGISPQTQFNGSSPVQIKIPDSMEVWTVNNAEGSAYGNISIWEATVKSVNAVFAQLIMKVGPPKVVEVAKRMGINEKIEPYPAIAIGGLTTGVSPLEMASAFGTLATNGERAQPIAIAKIVDSKGNVIFAAKPKKSRALDPKIAGQTTQILSDVIKRGTGTRANIDRPAAGKTGTAENYQDAWFVGYTPDLSAAVWMGHPEAQIEMRTVHGSPGFGGIIPATMWGEFMREALKDVPAHNFPPFEAPKTEIPKDQKSSNSTVIAPPSSTWRAPSTLPPSTTAPSTSPPTAPAPPPTYPPATPPPPTPPLTSEPPIPPPTAPAPPPTAAPRPTAPPTTQPPATRPP